MEDTCTFTILGAMCGLNDYISAERANRFIAANIKKDETMKSWAHAINAKKKMPIDANGLYDVDINWYEKDNRRDPDNVFFASKFILDGIVKANLLSGDGRRNIRHIHNDIFTDKDKPRIEVTLKKAL